MQKVAFPVADGTRRVVGSFGGSSELRAARAQDISAACDLVEIRLDLLDEPGMARQRGEWSGLSGLPLLFTARRREEGGGRDAVVAERVAWLVESLDDAACVDIEVATMVDAADLIGELQRRGLPWIASFHDFAKVPEPGRLEEAVAQAREAGAAAFKLAAMVREPRDLALLAEFQLGGHGMAVATMGMGPLAPVSRLLCAQCGSVLNYGFLGQHPTAPGQWDAGFLRQALGRLADFKSL